MKVCWLMFSWALFIFTLSDCLNRIPIKENYFHAPFRRGSKDEKCEEDQNPTLCILSTQLKDQKLNSFTKRLDS